MQQVSPVAAAELEKSVRVEPDARAAMQKRNERQLLRSRPFDRSGAIGHVVVRIRFHGVEREGAVTEADARKLRRHSTTRFATRAVW